MRGEGPADGVAAAATALARSEHAVALTGAGISVESGIPVFRGENGLWTKHGPPRLDSYQRFLRDPGEWWRGEINRSLEPWVVELREAARRARPNPGHEALASLEKSGALRMVITQNLDGLHQAAGSSNVVEIHGSRFKLRCVDCGHRTPREELFARQAPPPCEKCGGRVKHDSVLFGEPIPPDALAAAREAAERTDCMLAVGTSSTVRPAGGLPRIAKANGATLIEVNTLETSLSGTCDVVVRAPAGKALPLLASEVASKRVRTVGRA